MSSGPVGPRDIVVMVLPWKNGPNESFNGVFRDGSLGSGLFYTAKEAWLDEYNFERPHGALGGRRPAAYLEECPAKIQRAVAPHC